MFHVYILHSAAKDKYYVGFTAGNLQERLRRHNSNHKGFTGQSNDWVIAYYEAFTDKPSAMKREKEIKAKKSRAYIKELIDGSEHSGS
ncbi:GIY-YIG nuclease family protein [Niabella hirudinis]|uniref:GIY-YIG nuclease family protein n=2 Tax=Niabella hirudinis TaxID=1285929 RepID=UPI003EBEA2C9